MGEQKVCGPCSLDVHDGCHRHDGDECRCVGTPTCGASLRVFSGVPDHTPLTDEVLARWERNLAVGLGWNLLPNETCLLIADLRAAYADVERHAQAHYDAVFEAQQLQAEVERLRAALSDAVDEMKDMVAYVPDYFREKWKLDEAIERARVAIR